MEFFAVELRISSARISDRRQPWGFAAAIALKELLGCHLAESEG